jgi:hypothetical protein
MYALVVSMALVKHALPVSMNTGEVCYHLKFITGLRGMMSPLSLTLVTDASLVSSTTHACFASSIDTGKALKLLNNSQNIQKI